MQNFDLCNSVIGKMSFSGGINYPEFHISSLQYFLLKFGFSNMNIMNSEFR